MPISAPPSPSLRQLRTFLEVIRSGSISAAARALNVTQPAASQQLHALERTLGVRLVERAGGQVIATAAGASVLEPARRAAEAAEEAAAAARAHRSGGAGRVRLGTGASACIYLLPPALAALRRRMPGLEVLVATGNTPEMLERVAAGEIDAALVTLAGRVPRTLAVRPLFVDPLLALLPAGGTVGRAVLTPATLGAQPLILYERGGATREIIDAWFRRAGLAPRPVMELGSVEAIKVLVAGGFGASLLPRLALQQRVPGTVLAGLKPGLHRQIGIVLRREKVMERGLRLLIEELERAGAKDSISREERIPTHGCNRA